ncbi:MAG: CDP-alcohol phosphatidyltransferase family protein [Clostridia bacterium]|nr:CDP-alcohol phosphatidyltransferase family protein [Clostridia bacterium]
MLKQIPNILTILRFILIPFIIIAISEEQYILAVILFTVSSITDVLDGVIARKFNFITDFGKLMDPVADKLTQISIIGTLCLYDILPIWMVIVLVLKEFIMVVGAALLYKRKDVVVTSKWYGKLTTVLIYLAVVSSLVIKIFPSIGHKFSFLGYDMTFDIVIYLLAFIFALFSLLSYIQHFGKLLFRKNDSSENKKESINQ